MAKCRSMHTNSSSDSSTQLMSLVMQKSSTWERSQPPTVPLSLSARAPMLTTPTPAGPMPSPAQHGRSMSSTGATQNSSTREANGQMQELW